MKKRSLILLSVLVLVIAAGGFAWKKYSCGGCCKKDECKQTTGKYSTKMSWCCEKQCAAKNYDKSKIVPNSQAKTGDLTQCPVSGVIFTISESSAAIAYGGKSYHTCCGSCAHMFSSDPATYASNLN